YTDNNVTGFSNIYYRLEMVDLDGETKYSNMQAVSLAAKATSIYPNPATNGYIYVNVSSVFPLPYNIYNTGGQFIQSGVLSANNEAIDVTRLNSGTYVLKLDNGTSHILVK